MKMKVWLKEPNGEVLSPDDAAACWISAQHNALVLALLHQRYPFDAVEKLWADDDVRLSVKESEGVITWLLDGPSPEQYRELISRDATEPSPAKQPQTRADT
jgi:hypothetical protein